MNKTMNYTVEEINLMCIYHTDDRYILIKEMEAVTGAQRITFYYTRSCNIYYAV